MLKKVFMALLVVSMVALGMVATQRAQVEKLHKSVDMVLDYEEAVMLADQSEHDLEWWLKAFKEMGFTSVAVKESTLENLIHDKRPVEYHVIGDLKTDVNWRDGLPDELISYIENDTDDYDVLVFTGTAYWYDFIEKGLEARYPESFCKGFGSETGAFVLDGEVKDALYAETGYLVDEDGKGKREIRKLQGSKLTWIGLGFDPEIIETVKNSGLKVLPRPSNFERYPEKLVSAFEDEMKAFDLHPSYFVFQGESVTGYSPETEDVEDLYNYMNENNIMAGLIESGVQRSHVKQDGLKDLTKMLDYDGVRVFPVVGYIQERYQWYGYKGADEIENTIYRAVTERNIRSVYFRPFRQKDNTLVYVTDIDAYTETFKDLKHRLAEHNITFGEASHLTYNEPGIIQLILIGYGLVVLGIMALGSILALKEKVQWAFLAVGMVGISGALVVVPNFSETIMALGASILFPSLAAIVLLGTLKRFVLIQEKQSLVHILLKAVALLFVTVAISTVGGIVIGSILSSSEYLLEIEYFRGVKLSQLTPLAVFIIVYVVRFGYGRSSETLDMETSYLKDLKNLLHERIQVLHIIIGSCVVLMGVVYIARTGHETNIQPSNLEMLFRNFLEYNFLARPRSKELLMAFPSIIFVSYVALKRYRMLILPFSAVGMIGLTSVANTFSHLRAPLYLSLLRTGYGVAMGALLGIVAVIVVEVLSKIWHKLRGRTVNE